MSATQVSWRARAQVHQTVRLSVYPAWGVAGEAVASVWVQVGMQARGEFTYAV